MGEAYPFPLFSAWHEWSMAERLAPTLEQFRKTIAKPTRRGKAAVLLEQVVAPTRMKPARRRYNRPRPVTRQPR